MTQNNATYQRMDDCSDTNTSTQDHQALQQPQLISQRAMTSRVRHKGVLYRLGITEIVVGSLSALLGIITLIMAATKPGYYYKSFSGQSYFQQYYYDLTWSSQGIWGGAFAIVSGVFGVKAKSNPSVCIYNANMALSIIGANIMGVVVTISSFAVPNMDYRLHGLIVLHIAIGVLAFIGMAVCIVHSAYCCAGVCCRKPYQGGVMYAAQPGYQPQQMVQLANGQYMMVPAQAMAAQYLSAPLQMPGGHAAFQPYFGGLVAPVYMTAPQSHLPPTTVISQQITALCPAQQDAHLSSKRQEAEMHAPSGNPLGCNIVSTNQQ